MTDEKNDEPPKAPPPEKLSDNGAKTLQETRREVAEATTETEEKTKVKR